MSEEIVLWKLKNTETGNEMDIKTPYVFREKQITQRFRIPLYIKGVIISDEELAELGLERVGYTQDQLDAAHYAAIYEANPDLETRVRQYQQLLDGAGADYTMSLEEIGAAVDATESIEDKTAYKLEIKTIYDAIVTNMEFTGSETPMVDTYEQLGKLIQYLPEAAGE